MNEKQLVVWLCDKPVGKLQLVSGSMKFTYNEDAGRFLSLSMPLRAEPYKAKACEAFFGALLPDGPTIKSRIAKVLGLRSESSFSLLEQIGFDCAGAVSIRRADDDYVPEDGYKLQGTPIPDDDLYQLITQLPARPLFAGIEGFRISLGGAQDKAALCLIENQLCVPGPSVPTTHILKPPINGIQHSVHNEYFCMTLAKRVGLQTANVAIKRIGVLEVLLVERFDRRITDAGVISRIHQEDFCQALGVVSTRKYQADGGPTLRDCFDVIGHTTLPLLNKQELVKRVIFNFLIANTDCHAKNFSILHKSADDITLSPTYDILCGAVDEKLASKFAMTIGGRAEMNKISRENWRKFCMEVQLNTAALKRIGTELAEKLSQESSNLIAEMSRANLSNQTVEKIDELVQSRTNEFKSSIQSFSK